MTISREDTRRFARRALIALAFLLAAHGYRFFTLGFSGDALLLDVSARRWAELAQGLFLRPVYWRVRGSLAAPLLVGALSCLYLALAAALVCELLGFRREALAALACALPAADPAVLARFAAGLNTADAPFLAVLLCVLAVFLCARAGRLALCAPLLVAAALALDWNALPPALCLTVLLAVSALLSGEHDALRRAGRALLALAVGAALYALCLLALGSRLSFEPPSLSPAPVSDVLASLFGRLPYAHHPALCAACLALLALAAVAAFVPLARRAGPKRAAGVLLLAALLPLAARACAVFGAGDPPVEATFADAFLPVLALLLLDRADVRPLARFGGAMTCVVLLNAVVFSNQVYLKKDLDYESTLSLVTRIVDRAEQVEGYDPAFTPVVILGTPEDTALDRTRDGFEQLSAFPPARADYAIEREGDYAWYFWQAMGYAFNFAGDFERDALREREEVRAMPCFPAKGCCQIVDGTLVVKLAD